MNVFVEPIGIYLHRNVVDFRKLIDDLVAIIEGEFEGDAYTAHYFCSEIKRKTNSSWFTRVKWTLFCGTSDKKNIS